MLVWHQAETRRASGAPSNNKEGGAGISATRRLNVVTYSVRERMLILNTVSSPLSIKDRAPRLRRVLRQEIPDGRTNAGARRELPPPVDIDRPEPFFMLECRHSGVGEIFELVIDPIGITGRDPDVVVAKT